MFENKIILITGGTGSWGNELTKQILEKYNPKEIRIYSRGEHKQVQMKLKFSEHIFKLKIPAAWEFIQHIVIINLLTLLEQHVSNRNVGIELELS